MSVIPQRASPQAAEAESAYAWLRLATALVLGTIGSVGMWSVVVALPAVQAEFAVARADASLPFTLTMIGFGSFRGCALGDDAHDSATSREMAMASRERHTNATNVDHKFG